MSCIAFYANLIAELYEASSAIRNHIVLPSTRRCR